MKLIISMMKYLFAFCILNGITLVNCMQSPPLEGTDSLIARKERAKLIALKLEKEHYKDYIAHKDAYEKWPELEAIIKYKNQVCRNFFAELDFFKEEKNITASAYQIRLHYPLRSYHAVSVQGLRCYPPPKVNPSPFQNIILSRSPRLTCLLVLMPYKPKYLGITQGNHYQITGEICDAEYELISTSIKNESSNKEGNFGQYSQGGIVPKVKTNREVNEEVNPIMSFATPNEKNQQKMNKEVKHETMDEVMQWETVIRRMRNLDTPDLAQDDRTEREKKRVRFAPEFLWQ